MVNTPPFRTRIIAVRFKSGGELRLMEHPREAAHDQVVAWLNDEVKDSVAFSKSRMAGAVLVTWLSDGCIKAGVKIVHTSPYVLTAVPHIAADAVREVLQMAAIDRALGREDEAN